MRCLAAQHRIELRIAQAAELASVFEGPVNAKQAVGRQQAADAGKHRFDFVPCHDVAGIGRKYRVERPRRPIRLAHRQRQRCSDVRQVRLLLPGEDAGMVLRQVAAVPDQMRHGSAEIYRVLTGAAADFKYMRTVFQDLLEQGADGCAVAFAGGRELLGHGAIGKSVIAQCSQEVCTASQDGLK